MQRTVNSRAGLGSRKRHEAECNERKAESVLGRPAPAPANTDLHEWARQMREAQS